MATTGASISSQTFFKGSRSDGGFCLGFNSSDLRGLPSSSAAQICLRRLPQPSRRLEVKAIGNVFGNFFKVATYGESHGGGVGCTISGCPPRVPLCEANMQAELDRRRPGQNRITTPRKETDTCKLLSGISEGLTTGTSIHVFVPNTDQRSHDYSEMSIAYRPSHADTTYDFKYDIRSVQGGGRSSARETIGRVVARAVAKKRMIQFKEKLRKAAWIAEMISYIKSLNQKHLIMVGLEGFYGRGLALKQQRSLKRQVQTEPRRAAICYTRKSGTYASIQLMS